MPTAEEEFGEAMRNVDKTILKLAERRAAIDQKRKALNEEAAEIASNCDKLGILPASFNLAVRLVKGSTPGERMDFMNSTNRVMNAIGDFVGDLFPDEAARVQKRVDKAAEEASKKGPDPSTNPRSDPKRGGAGGADGHAPAQDAKPPAKSKGRRPAAAKGGDNVVPMKKGKTASAATAEAAKSSEAMVKDVAARIAQQKPGQPGDGSAADLQSNSEQEEGDAYLSGTLDKIKAKGDGTDVPPGMPPAAPADDEVSPPSAPTEGETIN